MTDARFINVQLKGLRVAKIKRKWDNYYTCRLSHVNTFVTQNNF